MIKTDICVIGGGSGGLSVAAGAVQMGASVVLCEGGKMGGDCLNYGCVPSKAMIEASRIITHTHKAEAFGINIGNTEVDYKKVQQHVKNTIAKIQPHDSVERFEGLGVKVIQENAYIVDKHTIQAGEHIIKAKYTVIATGSSASIPNIQGIDTVKYETNETIFDIEQKPQHLMIIGGGVIAIELAQAHVLLGCKVTIFEAAKEVLGILDSEVRNEILAEFIRLKLDIKIITNADIQNISKLDEAIQINCNGEDYIGSHLLVAAGRTANINKLNLEKAKISYTNKGINVDKRLRTNYKNIFAIGDVIGGYQFTHAAGYQAGIVIQNILFKLPAKVSYKAFPWSIYTTPEIAHVGLSTSGADKGGHQVLKVCFKDNDRAQASLSTGGFVKVIVNSKGYILGATIVGENAGELITQWTLAINNKLKIKNIASTTIAYPSLGELNKKIAGNYFLPILYSKKVKIIVKFLMRFLSKKI